MNSIYPDLIKGLPEADIPFKGVKGWLSQSDDHQIVFFDIEPIGKVAEHAHGAQWGFVIDGEIVIRKILPLTGTFDHRIIDGYHAGMLAHNLKRYLENPELLAVAPVELKAESINS